MEDLKFCDSNHAGWLLAWGTKKESKEMSSWGLLTLRVVASGVLSSNSLQAS